MAVLFRSFGSPVHYAIYSNSSSSAWVEAVAMRNMCLHHVNRVDRGQSALSQHGVPSGSEGDRGTNQAKGSVGYALVIYHPDCAGPD